MITKRYFESGPCVMELVKALELGIPVVPIFLERVNMKGEFLGSDAQQIKNADFIKAMMGVNRVPPPDQGFFLGHTGADFERNVGMLVDALLKFL